MRLADCREAYQYNSGQTSSNVRQLGFAALAAIWLFKDISTEDTIGLPLALWWVGFLSIGALLFDFFQYLWNSIAWGQFHRKQELSGVSQDIEFLAPVWINWPGIALFTIKVSSIILCYIVLLMFLWITIKSF